MKKAATLSRIARAPRPSLLGRAAILVGVTITLSLTPAVRADDAAINTPPRVHTVNGLWHRYYRLDEAFAHAGMVHQSESWHSAGSGFGVADTWASGYPSSIEFFPGAGAIVQRHDLVVINNVNGKAFRGGQLAGITRHVERGGGLLLLGGRFAFGGQWKATPLADVAPVTFSDGIDLIKPDKPLAITTTDSELGRRIAAAADFSSQPRVVWMHDVTPLERDDVQVVLRAGNKPLLIVGTFGEGRVALFAGTVLGESPADAQAFWEWHAWPAVMAVVLDWLAEPGSSLRERDAAAVAEELDKLSADLLLAIKASDIQAIATRHVHGLAERKAALQVARALADAEGDIAADAWLSLATAMAVSADDMFAGTAADLVASGQPYRTALGLVLLGKSRGGEAVTDLVRLHTQGAPSSAADDDMSLGAPGGGDPEVAKAIRRAAVIGLGLTRSEQAHAPLRNIAHAADGTGGKGSKGRGSVVEGMSLTDANYAYQQAVMSSLIAGDVDIAPKVTDALIDNIYAIARSRTEMSDYDWSFIVRRTPDMLAFQQSLYDLLAHVPDDALLPIAMRIAAHNDVRVAPVALAVFAGRSLTDDTRAALRQSPVPAVKRLAGSDAD